MRTCSMPMGAEHEAAALRVVRSGVLTEGPETEALENEFAGWLGVDLGLVVAVSSGTAALSALLVANGISAGNLVAVPAFTFSATALAARRIGARLALIDVNSTWNLDPQRLAAFNRGRPAQLDAVIGVDLHGVPANWTAIEKAVPRSVTIIEDACPAYGARLDGRPAGTLAPNGAAFSLNESKQLPAGEGGLVVAPTPEIADVVRALRAFGELPRSGGARRSVLTGDNWKITEAAAALARAGLPTLTERVMTARYAGDAIRRAAAESAVLSAPPITPNSEPSWFKIRLSAPDAPTAELAEEYLRRHGVPIRDGEVDPLHRHPAFESSLRGPTANADEVRRTIVVGSRAEPIFTASPPTADRWAEVIASIPAVSP